LGGENIHTLFGVKKPKHTIYDFLNGVVPSLNDLVKKTDIDRLFLISGQKGALGAANIQYSHKLKLLSHLKELDCDHLILDIGAGTTYNQLDFFLAADQGILVTMPEPHAIQDAFYFVKSALFRKIALQFRKDPFLSEYFKSKLHYRVEQIKTFLEDIKDQSDATRGRIDKIIKDFKPKLILNQVMHASEVKDGRFFIKSLKDMLEIDADYLGYIQFDPSVRRATQNLRPLIIDQPKSKAATCIFSMLVFKLLNRQFLKGKLEEKALQKKIRGLDYEAKFKGYRSGAGIYE